jgi:hypothetical protein
LLTNDEGAFAGQTGLDRMELNCTGKRLSQVPNAKRSDFFKNAFVKTYRECDSAPFVFDLLINLV